MKQATALLFSLIFLAISCSKNDDFTTDSGKSGSITRFAVFGNYMYVLNQKELLTYSLENPDNPALVHRLVADYGLETIIIYDNTIYLGSTTSLYILDIGNPAAPQILSKTDRVEIFLGGCDPVVVKDNYAYSTIKIIANVCGTVSSESALIVYDVSDKSNPVSVSSFLLSIPNGLGYKDNYLFVCDEGSDQLVIFDITNPLSVTRTNYSVEITDPYDLIVEGNRMIVSTKTDFQIFDVSDITAIRRTGHIPK